MFPVLLGAPLYPTKKAPPMKARPSQGFETILPGSVDVNSIRPEPAQSNNIGMIADIPHAAPPTNDTSPWERSRCCIPPAGQAAGRAGSVASSPRPSRTSGPSHLRSDRTAAILAVIRKGRSCNHRRSTLGSARQHRARRWAHRPRRWVRHRRVRPPDRHPDQRKGLPDCRRIPSRRRGDG